MVDFSKIDLSTYTQNIKIPDVKTEGGSSSGASNSIYTVLTSNTGSSASVNPNGDGTIRMPFGSGTKEITKSGNTTIETIKDEMGNVLEKTETTIEGNGKTTIIKYEGERQVSKTVMDPTTGDTIIEEDGKKTTKKGDGTEIVEEDGKTTTTTKDGAVTVEEDGVKTTTTLDGTTIVEKEGEKVTTFPDGSTETVITDGNKTTTTTKTNDGKETVKTEENGVTTTINSENGKPVSQTITKDGTTSTVEYDNNGNTKGVVVQNGESPAVIAKKFGCDVQALLDANPNAVKGNAPNQYFLVGADIVIPGQMDASKFAELNAGRQSKAENENAYNTAMETKKAEADADLQATLDYQARQETGHARMITANSDTFEQHAIEMYKREGVNNPTQAQIDMRADELRMLNPDLKDGEINGKRIKTTITKELDVEISINKNDREIKENAQKRETETKEGKDIAQQMFEAIDGASLGGGVRKESFKEALKKTNENNVVGVIRQYEEIPGAEGESLVHGIMNETGDVNERKEACVKLVNELSERAIKSGVSSQRVDQLARECIGEINSYLLGGVVNTSDLETAINTMMGAIDCIEATTHEYKSTSANDSTSATTLSIMDGQISDSKADFEAQLNENGWCENLWEGIKSVTGSDNTADGIKADLNEYEKYMDQLQDARKNGDAAFAEEFKQIFGVEYDANLVKGYTQLQNDFNTACGLQALKDEFDQTFDVNTSNNDYDTKRENYAEFIKSTMIEEVDPQLIEESIDEMIAKKLEDINIDYTAATSQQVQDALNSIIQDSRVALEGQLQLYTQGRSLDSMQKDLESAATAVFGTENDITTRVNEYIISQQKGGAVINAAAKVGAAVVIGVATGGTGLAALITTSAATTGASFVIDVTDQITSTNGMSTAEFLDITKNAVVDGASVFAGGQVVKYTAKLGKGAQFVANTATDTAIGTGASFIQNGKMSNETVLKNALFASVGNSFASGSTNINVKAPAKNNLGAPHVKNNALGSTVKNGSTILSSPDNVEGNSIPDCYKNLRSFGEFITNKTTLKDLKDIEKELKKLNLSDESAYLRLLDDRYQIVQNNNGLDNNRFTPIT